jgi:hypothetical protein
MENLFQAVMNANAPKEEQDSWQFGIVADNKDPLKLGRLQVYDQAKGGKYKSSWLFRALPFTSFTPPVPKVGDLVCFGYIDGNPHQGCYSGVIVNNINAAVGGDNDFTIVLGGAKVVITSTGSVSVTNAKEVTVEATTVNIKASGSLNLEASTISMTAGTATLAGKDIAVKGAVDSRGDSLVTKGW